MDRNAEMRRRILETARELFAQQGVGKTTLEDIGRRVHRTKSFIYHYFPGKDGVLAALIETEGDAYAQQLREAVAHAIQIAMKGFEIEWATSDKEQFEQMLDDLLGALFDGVAKHGRSAIGAGGTGSTDFRRRSTSETPNMGRSNSASARPA